MIKRSCTIALIFTLITFIPSYGDIERNSINISGQAAIVMEVETGRVLFEKNTKKMLPMASTTKIMTALLAIENIPLDTKVKINPRAQGIEGSSIYLKAEEEISAIDLIYGLMLRSGNDSAEAIAYEVSGNIEQFAKLMNERAKEIGADNTNFVNPHGLHDKNHYTTAYDLALISREALKNPIFKEVVKARYWTADREGYNYFANKNDILDICEGGDGVKTGYTTSSGRCLVASATRNDMQLVAITLNDYNWFSTSKSLLDNAFENYSPYLLFNKNQILTRVNVIGGKKKEVSVRPVKNIIIPIAKDEVKKLISVIDIPENVEAPIEFSKRAGKVTTYLDGKIINTVFLSYNDSVEKQSIFDKIKSIFKK